MQSMMRRLALAAGLAALIAPSVRAQNLAVYGAAEAAGFGESSAILGATLTPGHLGWNWLLGANVQTYRFRRTDVINADGSPHIDQRVAFNPQVGVEYRGVDGAIDGTVGYNLTSGDVTANNNVGAPGGGQNSPTVGAVANYWGGIFEHSFIVSYATKPEYLWTRARLAARPTTAPVYLGGEFVAQGGSQYGYRYQAGPTLNVHFTPNFHAGIDGGVRWNTAPSGTTVVGSLPKSGYVGIYFVALSAF